MIVFTLCPPFHGATLLSLLLNNHSKILALGDTNPARTFEQGCSCGEKVADCAFWKEISEQTNCTRYDDKGIDGKLPQYPVYTKRAKLDKMINLALVLLARAFGPGIWWLGGRPARDFFETYDAFIRACDKLAPHDVFVDGEKALLKFMILASRGGQEMKVIYVARDPRGYVYSCSKYRPEVGLAEICHDLEGQHRRIRMALHLFGNIPSMVMRYEDLAQNPEQTLAKMQDFLGVQQENLVGPPRDPQKHHLIGNKMLQVFDGQVRHDENWRKSLSTEEQDEVLQHAKKIFKQFGYQG